jgi:hypothetical protein
MLQNKLKRLIKEYYHISYACGKVITTVVALAIRFVQPDIFYALWSSAFRTSLPPREHRTGTVPYVTVPYRIPYRRKSQLLFEFGTVQYGTLPSICFIDTGRYFAHGTQYNRDMKLASVQFLLIFRACVLVADLSE